jgi:N-acetylglucosaminyldiphosphoundecaprenol N-acetyl-beta-D-mannosaminyltransferase
MTNHRSLHSRYILDTRIDATSYSSASRQILAWARAHETRSVFCANVHMVMEGFDHPLFRSQINAANLVTSDGMPLVWALRRLGVHDATRVYGPDLTNVLLNEAAAEGLRVGFLGATPETLARLLTNVRARHPSLVVPFAFSPPFDAHAPDEDAAIVGKINSAEVQILFVGLGCPKQERWIAHHRDRLHCVALGVGAAFDLLARTKPQAPRWMQSSGLEWLFRVLTEPRRLWRRYLTTNPRFIWHFALQLLSGETQMPQREIQ